MKNLKNKITLPKIIGYGEDALTYWALSNKLKDVLSILKDNSPLKDCNCFYRPSFGRGEYYGEFDAIISTNEAVYLIESKWDKSSQIKKSQISKQTPNIDLDYSQLLRHKILTWYISNLTGTSDSKEWNLQNKNFKYQNSVGKDKKFAIWDGTDGSILNQNIRSVLNIINAKNKKLINVLFYFKKVKGKNSNIRLINNKQVSKLNNTKIVFKILEIPYTVIPNSNFFNM